MTPAIRALLKISDKTIINQQDILSSLNNILADYLQDLFDRKVEIAQGGLFEKLSFQIVLHNSSLLKLSESRILSIKEKKIEQFDISGIYTLCRLQFESFINLVYLYFIAHEIPNEIRISVYKIHGLRKQLSLTSHHEKSHPAIAKIRNEISTELQAMRNNRFFVKSKAKEKEKFVNPTYARLAKPLEVLRKINLSSMYDLYLLYSNHIHAEYIGMRQLNSAMNGSSSVKDSISTTLLMCSRLTAVTIQLFNKRFALKESAYAAAPLDDRQLVEELSQLIEK